MGPACFCRGLDLVTGAVFSPFSIGRAQPGWLPARRSFERRDGRTAHPAANAPTRRDGPGALTPRLVRVARPARRGKDDRHQADVVGGTASPIDAKRGRPAAGAGRRRPGRLEAHVSRLFPARRRALATAQGPEERQGVLLQRRHEGERLGRSETRGAGDGGGEARGSVRCRSIRCRSIRCRSIRCRSVRCRSVRRHPARRQTPGRRPAPPQIGGGFTPPGGEVVRIRRPNEPATDGRARGVPAQSGGSRARPRGEEVRSREARRGRAPAPKRHGPFFVSGVVAVFTSPFSPPSSRGSFDRCVRCVQCEGRGGRRRRAGGDGSDPLAVELRALAGTQLAKWFKRTKERLRRKMRAVGRVRRRRQVEPERLGCLRQDIVRHHERGTRPRARRARQVPHRDVLLQPVRGQVRRVRVAVAVPGVRRAVRADERVGRVQRRHGRDALGVSVDRRVRGDVHDDDVPRRVPREMFGVHVGVRRDG